MVPDGYYYAFSLIIAAALIGWLAAPIWAVPMILLAVFFLWFFRDPRRAIPEAAGYVVSPADGKVTDISPASADSTQHIRISIFLNVFDVHVNRSPIAGVVRSVQYSKGKFLNAMNAASSEQNERNVVTVDGEGHTVIFKQIAGLLARRIVFNPRVGDKVQRGERVGLIKFGSRVDVLLPSSAILQIKVGDRVKGGSSVLATMASTPDQLAFAGSERTREGVR